ncbi:MAG: hypothetical protein K2O34_08140 [Acetatifactor sp.]|nr:hypothetical protein [Acetatifactor sp.]
MDIRGSYINIGLIGDKVGFGDKVVKLLCTLDGLRCTKLEYPTNENYSDWIECQLEQSGIEAAIERCIQSYMAKITGSFLLGGYELKDVLLRVEALPDHTNCFYIEMPELQNPIFKDIDMAEQIIISFFKEISVFEFSKGFCDSEAAAGDKMGYAISVDYKPSVNIRLQSWKIDGLTNR